ncbi:unnamed protein product [Prunus armeniaca]
MSMEDLILRLRVEEDHRKGDKGEVPIIEAEANVLETSKLNSRKTRARKLQRIMLILMHQKARISRKSKALAGYVEN